MPTSKKRVKKESEEAKVIVRNPVKTPLGKIVIITLSFGFVLAIVVSLVYVMYEIAIR